MKRIARACAVVLALTMASVASGGGVAVAAPSAEPPVTSPTIPGPRAARPATATDIESYRQREKKASPALAQFAGGDVVVITASTVVIILLVVLLIVLLR